MFTKHHRNLRIIFKKLYFPNTPQPFFFKLFLPGLNSSPDMVLFFDSPTSLVCRKHSIFCFYFSEFLFLRYFRQKAFRKTILSVFIVHDYQTLKEHHKKSQNTLDIAKSFKSFRLSKTYVFKDGSIVPNVRKLETCKRTLNVFLVQNLCIL